MPQSRTRDTDLPGAWGIERARDLCRDSGLLSAEACERMVGVYGGRAATIIELALSNATLAACLTPERDYLLAEIVFTIREEFAMTLADIVFRRTMMGFRPDQGRPFYEDIAACTAAELGWSAARKGREMADLIEYADSLRIDCAAA